jgi:hypothetical protein
MRRVILSVLSFAPLLLLAGTLAACGTGSGPLSSLSPTRPPLTRSVQPSGAASPSVAPSAASAPATSAQASAPAPTSAPVSGSGNTAIWLWVLLGAAVLAVVITWIALAARHRTAASATSAGEKSRVIEAYAKGAALYDAMSVAETPGALVAADAGARWSDILRRADDLNQTLYALREEVSDEDERAKATDVLAALQAVCSAMDAERAPTGAGPQQPAVIRDRLFSFDAALRALRAPYDPAPRTGQR